VSKVELSVVVAAWNTPALLERCLTSLQEQCKTDNIEIIVVCNYDGGAREMIRTQFPSVKHLNCPESTTVPDLRAQGILQSTGEVVALLEDHCFVHKDWCAEIKKAHRLSHSAVGGSVENASTVKAIDWAVYFYDYGKYMLPGLPGATDSLSGNNVSYKRSALYKLEKEFQNGFYETFMNLSLKSSGCELFFVPSAIVYHNKSYRVGEALIECYHHARAFAGKRAARARPLKRVVYTLGSTLLPVLLPVRIMLTVLSKGRHARQLLFALPHIVLLMAGWSVGEFTGYMVGEGSSASKWA